MLSTDDIPQADRFERVVQLVVSAVQGAPEQELDARDLAYYRQAARILGWLDERHEPTADGLALAHATDSERWPQVAQAFARSAVGERWRAWSGVERLDQLDEDSAEDFLAECSDASASTASRRARSLKSWLRALREFDVAHVEGDEALKVFLSRPLADPAIPTRMVNWAERNGVHTLAELVMRTPAALIAEKNLGRKSIADTDALLRERTGLSWSELRARLSSLGFGAPRRPGESAQRLPPVTEEGAPPDWETLSWDQLGRALPPALRELPLSRLELPTRMRKYCEQEGISSLHGLLSRSEASLREARNLGRTSIRDSKRAIVRWLVTVVPVEGDASVDAGVLHPAIEDYPDFFSLWRQRLASLSAQERLIITQRIGVLGEAATLEDIGALLNVTRERVRQLESSAIERLCRDRWWIEGIEARLEDELEDGVVSLAELASDPWFHHVDVREGEFRYFLKRFAGGTWSLDELLGQSWLSHARSGELDSVAKSITRALRRLAFPCKRAEVETLVAAQANQLPKRFTALLLESLQGDLHSGEQDGVPVYTGFGQTRLAAVLAHVRASSEPVSVRTLEAEFGRGALPDELVYVRRGAVTAPQNIPGFFVWQERLVPACVALMREHGPERQWSTEELMELLATVARLPEWLTIWLLAGMLRLSDQVLYLGRLRVSLPESQRESRAFVHEVARSVLLAAERPLPEDELRKRVEAQTAVGEIAWSTIVSGERGGVVRVSATGVGLIERDVPGGEEAFAEAAEILQDRLTQRQVGLSVLEALALLREADERYATWTREMVHAVGRSSPLLRTAVNGSVGLSAWEDVRVPGQREIVREALDAGSGRAPLAAVLDRIEALHGTRPTRATMVNVAVSAGGRLRGEEIWDAARCEESAARPSAAQFPSLAELPGFPGVARDLFQRFAEEPLGDFAALKRACLAYVLDFQRAAQTNEFVSVAEAEQLATLCGRLLDACGTRGANEPARRLSWATARYFVKVEDADADFSIGGLDDDIAVANAVACYLGHEDWCISLEA